MDVGTLVVVQIASPHIDRRSELPDGVDLMAVL